MTNREARLNQILDSLFDVWIPILCRLMVVAVFVLAFLGLMMATRYFYLVSPNFIGQLPTGAKIFLQAVFLLYWPVTVAPLWWKLSFFIMGGLILLPRLLTIRD